MFGEFPATQILGALKEDNLLPSILFRTARRQCDDDIQNMLQSRAATLPQVQQDIILKAITAVREKYQVEAIVVETHPHYGALITTGVGAHHAGQLLVWRLLLEELMSKGLLRMMIATGTVAAGVDFPARSVVITSHSKRGAEGFDVLTSSEFQQMSGRAGRRGKDAVGICVIAPTPYADARVLNEVAKRPPEPLRSAYFAAPATVLNLLKFRNVDDLRHTVSKSLAAYLDGKNAEIQRSEARVEEAELAKSDFTGEKLKKAEKRVRRKMREADDLAGRQLVVLEKSLEALRGLGYMEGGGLSEKGYWAASLCTSLVLELGEAIHDHLLSELSVYHLAGLVSSIAADPHRPYFSLKANPVPKELFTKLSAIVARVKAVYTTPATLEMKVVPEAALTVITWMNSADWTEFASLLKLNGVAEGDVARLVNQTADHLNQIGRLTESHPDLARTALEARAMLLRPPLSEGITLAAARR